MATKTKSKKAAPKKQAAKAEGSKPVGKTTAADSKPTPKIDESPADQKPTGARTPATREATQQQPDDSEQVCVFAFRLTRAERDEIHHAAGSAKASKFVRGLALAAARGDTKAIKQTMETIQKTD